MIYTSGLYVIFCFEKVRHLLSDGFTLRYMQTRYQKPIPEYILHLLVKTLATATTLAMNELFKELETPEGETNIFRIAKARDKASKDFSHTKQIKNGHGVVLTISVLQAYCAVITEYGIPSDFVRKSTASLQIKI